VRPRVKEKEVEATLLVEEYRIMMTDLILMEPETRAWIEKNQTIMKSHYFVCNYELCLL
jgi:hypothetical protein